MWCHQRLTPGWCCSGEQPLARLWSKIQAAEDALARLAQLQVSHSQAASTRSPSRIPAASQVLVLAVLRTVAA